MSNRGLLGAPLHQDLPGRGLFGYPAGWPTEQRTRQAITPIVSSCTAAGVANQKGAWNQLCTLAGADSFNWITLAIGGGLNNGRYLMDVAVDPQGDPSTPTLILITNVQSCERPVLGGNRWRCTPLFFGLPILPEGTTVFARCQSDNANRILDVRGMVGSTTFASGPLGAEAAYGTSVLGTTITYGATAGSALTTVDPGAGGSFSKGAWSQLVAATTEPIRYLTVLRDNMLNNTRSGEEWLVDIGIGHSGSEEVLVPDLGFQSESNADFIYPSNYGPFPIYIPAGTRLAARAGSSSVDATDRLIGIGVCGNA